MDQDKKLHHQICLLQVHLVIHSSITSFTIPSANTSKMLTVLPFTFSPFGPWSPSGPGGPSKPTEPLDVLDSPYSNNVLNFELHVVHNATTRFNIRLKKIIQ